jgi:phosphoenolpyruvate carboxylase
VNISSDDKELRQSIRQLDSLLTHVLKTQARPETVAMVEQLRWVREIDPKEQGKSSWMKPLLRFISSIPAGMRNAG